MIIGNTVWITKTQMKSYQHLFECTIVVYYQCISTIVVYYLYQCISSAPNLNYFWLKRMLLAYIDLSVNKIEFPHTVKIKGYKNFCFKFISYLPTSIIQRQLIPLVTIVCMFYSIFYYHLLYKLVVLSTISHDSS